MKRLAPAAGEGGGGVYLGGVINSCQRGGFCTKQTRLFHVSGTSSFSRNVLTSTKKRMILLSDTELCTETHRF